MSSFRSIFRPLLFLLGVSSDSQSGPLIELPFFDGDELGFHVGSWCLVVKSVYLSKPLSREWKVVQIERYRGSSHPQHEYLVASLEHPTHKNAKVRIDREPPPVGLDGKPVLFGNETPLDEEPYYPNDRVRFHSRSFLSWIQDTRIERLNLRDNPISLVHLTILARTVHKKASLYSFFEAHCFWFADLIIRVLAKQRNQSDQLSKGTKEERCYSPQSGTFDLIPVDTARAAIMEEIENTFNESWNDFSNEVTEALAEEKRILSQDDTIASQAADLAAERERAAAERERAAAELAAERERAAAELAAERERAAAERAAERERAAAAAELAAERERTAAELLELRKLLAQSRQGGQTSA